MAESQQTFWFRHSDGFAVVKFPQELSHAHMEEVRNAGLKAIEHLSMVKSPKCLVDLSALSYMGSSMVASIVRIWKTVKEQDGRMVVVASNEQTVEVLKAAGLGKVWTIVGTTDEGMRNLGVSAASSVSSGEFQPLTYVGPPAVVAAAVVLAGRVVPGFRDALVKMRIGIPPEWLLFMLGGMAVLASGVSVSRERGLKRILSGLTLGLSLIVIMIAIARSPGNAPPPAAPAESADQEKSAEGAEAAPRKKSSDPADLARPAGNVSGLPGDVDSDAGPAADKGPVPGTAPAPATAE